MKRFKLYGTSACHLCELAHAMLAKELPSVPGCAFQEVDITEDDQLFETYGIRIPVLAHPDGSELGWPFQAGELRDFLLS